MKEELWSETLKYIAALPESIDGWLDSRSVMDSLQAQIYDIEEQRKNRVNVVNQRSKTVIAALVKQVPIKPLVLENEDGTVFRCCPECGKKYIPVPKYCPECGQRFLKE